MNKRGKIFETVTSSAEETMEVGENLAGRLKGGDIVTLVGELGSGKTTFVQGMFRKLGIKGFARSSSFILANEYKSKKNRFYHIDLYRLGGIDINNLGLEEYFRPDCITVIEWADRLKTGSLKPSVKVAFKWLGERERRVRIS
jgi:tRNA threonylcarbamoyladenosine biosynthesis protein TsaE